MDNVEYLKKIVEETPESCDVTISENNAFSEIEKSLILKELGEVFIPDFIRINDSVTSIDLICEGSDIVTCAVVDAANGLVTVSTSAMRAWLMYEAALERL